MRGHALDLGKEHERQRKETGFHGKTIAVFADNYASRNYGLYQDCDVGGFVVCLPPDIREYDALIGHVIDPSRAPGKKRQVKRLHDVKMQ